jgi:hypothetical protein
MLCLVLTWSALTSYVDMRWERFLPLLLWISSIIWSMVNTKMNTKFWSENLKGWRCLEDIGGGWRIILKFIITKCSGRVWTGFIWTGLGPGGGLFWKWWWAFGCFCWRSWLAEWMLASEEDSTPWIKYWASQQNGKIVFLDLVVSDDPFRIEL